MLDATKRENVIAALTGMTLPDIMAIVKEANPGHFCTPEQIDVARTVYQDDECEIDDNAAISEGDDGYWVASWVWVADEMEVL